MNDDNTLEQRALRRAKAKMGWFSHAGAYLAVNLGLVLLSLANGEAWAIYPLLGWGVGLLAHGVSVWLLPSGDSLFEHLLARERAKLAATPRNSRW